MWRRLDDERQYRIVQHDRRVRALETHCAMAC
jgi:hypothetical protein